MPVTKPLALLLARNKAAPTSSLGSPNRPIGVCPQMDLVLSVGEPSSLNRSLRFCSAGKKPGVMELTRTPFGASSSADAPHLPQPALIDAYGDGGFRFGGMSHRGSLLCFPDGIWAWPVGDAKQLNEEVLAAVFSRAQTLDFFLIGAGRDPWPLPDALRQRFRDCNRPLSEFWNRTHREET